MDVMGWLHRYLRTLTRTGALALVLACLAVAVRVLVGWLLITALQV